MIFKTECTHVVSQNNTHFPDMVLCVNGTQPEKKIIKKNFSHSEMMFFVILSTNYTQNVTSKGLRRSSKSQTPPNIYTKHVLMHFKAFDC